MGTPSSSPTPSGASSGASARQRPVFWISFLSRFSCPYLDNRRACYQVRLPDRPLDPQELDRLLAQGYRRQGEVMYRVRCPGCQACEPLRVPVDRFRPNRSQRRTWRRGQEQLEVRLTVPQCDQRHLELFDLHRRLRGLSADPQPTSEQEYRQFLVESCCPSLELQYWLQDQLVAVAVADRGYEALSAVYCYYDPGLSRLSLGTFSILTQLELCRRWGMKYLYLGFYVAQNPHMNYKARFRPHQRLLHGQWQEFL